MVHRASIGNADQICSAASDFEHFFLFTTHCTVRKNDIILRSIERMLQTQLSMARKFPLWRLRRYMPITAAERFSALTSQCALRKENNNLDLLAAFIVIKIAY
jgi:hypothetical protein